MSVFGFSEKQSDNARLSAAPIGSHLVEVLVVNTRRIKDPTSKRPENEPFFKVQYKIVLGKPTSNEVPCDPGDVHEQTIFMDKVGKSNTDLLYFYASAVAAQFDLTAPYPIDRMCLAPASKTGRPLPATPTALPGFGPGIVCGVCGRAMYATTAEGPWDHTDPKEGKPCTVAPTVKEYFNILADGVTTEAINAAIMAKLTIICVEEMLLAHWRPGAGKYLQLKRGLNKTKTPDPATGTMKEFPTHRWQPMSIDTRAWIAAGGIEKTAARRAAQAAGGDALPGSAPATPATTGTQTTSPGTVPGAAAPSAADQAI